MVVLHRRAAQTCRYSAAAVARRRRCRCWHDGPQGLCVLLDARCKHAHHCRYLKDVKLGQGLSLAQALASNLGPKIQGQVRGVAG